MSDYYTFDPATMILEEALQRWVKNNEKAYDGPHFLKISEVWPYREYHWTRTNHRDGAVPHYPPGNKFRGAKDRWYFMTGFHHGTPDDPPTAEHIERLKKFDSEYKPGNRWDALLAYMKQYGWDEDPAHLFFGKNGIIKLGEGNHRTALAKAAGLIRIPVMFHFQQEVHYNKQP